MTKMQILIPIVIIKWQKLSTGLRSIHEILVVMTILLQIHKYIVVYLLLPSNESNHWSTSIYERDWSKFNDWWRKLKIIVWAQDRHKNANAKRRWVKPSQFETFQCPSSSCKTFSLPFWERGCVLQIEMKK